MCSSVAECSSLITQRVVQRTFRASGSTGLPKGALLSQKAIMCNALMSVEAHGLSENDTALVVLPLFHVGGLNILPTPAFSVGATVILHERFEPETHFFN